VIKSQQSERNSSKRARSQKSKSQRSKNAPSHDAIESLLKAIPQITMANTS